MLPIGSEITYYNGSVGRVIAWGRRTSYYHVIIVFAKGWHKLKDELIWPAS